MLVHLRRRHYFCHVHVAISASHSLLVTLYSDSHNLSTSLLCCSPSHRHSSHDVNRRTPSGTWSLPMASLTPEILSLKPPSAGISGLQQGTQLLVKAAADPKSSLSGCTTSKHLAH